MRHLKRQIGYASIVFVCLALLPAQTAVSGEPGSVLWTVARPGTPTSYLLGTIHSDDPRVVGLSPAIETALHQSSSFAMELIPDFSALGDLSAAMTLPPGKDLGDYMSPSLLRKVIAALGERGIGKPVALHMRPWAVMTNLSIPKSRTGQFLDLVLYQKAVLQKKRTVGLETVAEQLGFLQGLPMAVKREFISETLKVGHAQELAAFAALLDAYLANDLAKVTLLSNQQLESVSKTSARLFRERGIWQRNARMLKRALPLFAKGHAFVAVGALHLPEKHGLINGLRKAGYHVEPVACAWSKSRIHVPVKHNGVATCPPS